MSVCGIAGVRGRGLALVLAVGVLAGCAEKTGLLPKGFHNPDQAVQSKAVVREYTEQAFPPAAESGPLTLERAVEEALRASPELEQMRARMNAAGEQVRQAEAAFYPRLVVSEDYNVTNNPVYALMNIINQKRFNPWIDFNNPGTQQNFGTYFRGEWSLFEGGSRWAERKAAMAGRRSLNEELRAARNQMVARVIEVYYQWMQAMAYIGVAERALEAAKTDERLAEARVRAEAALPSDLMRLRARRAEMQGNLVSAQTSASRLQGALERLLGRPIKPAEIPVPQYEANGVKMEDPFQGHGENVRKALERRPEMQAVRALLEAAEERVKAARGGYLPRLGSNAWYGLDSERLGRFSDSWMVAVQASWPIFEGGLTAAKLEEARLRLKETAARGEQVALDIALEVQQAELAVAEAVAKTKVAEERRLWAEKALTEVRHIYSRQAATVDALLQAEVAWNQAEVSHTAARFECEIARASFRRALGDFADGLSGGSTGVETSIR